MKKNLTLLVFFFHFTFFVLTLNTSLAQTGFTASYNFGFSSSGLVSGKAVQKKDKGFLITGRVRNNSQLLTTIGSTDSLGNILWGGVYCDLSLYYSAFDITSLLELYDKGCLLAGTFDTTSASISLMHYVIVRLDSNGNVVWEKSLHDTTYGFTNEKFTGITKSFDGGFILTGNHGTIVKTDSIGNTLWTKSIWSGTFNKLISVSNYNYIALVNNNTIIKFDSSFSILWSKSYSNSLLNLSSVIETINHGYVLAGAYDSAGVSGIGSLFILRVDSSGNFLSALKSDSSFIIASEPPVSLILMSDSGIVLSCTSGAGFTESNILVRFTQNGSILSSRFWYSDIAHNVNNSDLIRTENGGYAFPGIFTFRPSADQVFMLATFDSADSNICGTTPFAIQWIPDTVTIAVQNFTLQPLTLVETYRTMYHSTQANNYFFCVQANSTHTINFKDDLQLSPNPTSTIFTITTDQSEIKSIDIFNLLGEKIFSTPLNKNEITILPGESVLWRINVETFPAGIYFVSVRTENGVAVQKLVKE